MSTTHTSEDKIKYLATAYENLLEKALHQTVSNIHHSIDSVQDDLTAMGKLTTEEAKHLKHAVKRDLSHAAHHMQASKQDLKSWLGFDLELIKVELWQKFIEATDKTTLELIKIKNIAADAQYHTGEMIGLGTLVCDHCQTNVHFRQPSHIPPCSKCHGTEFHRQHHEA
jgi:polyhydroxyalkanoate synthesis regulator phasin